MGSVVGKQRFTPEMLEAIKRKLGPDDYAKWFVNEMKLVELAVRAKDPDARGIELGAVDERPDPPLFWIFSPRPHVRKTEPAPREGAIHADSPSTEMTEAAPATNSTSTSDDPDEPWRGSLPRVDHSEHVQPPKKPVF